MLNIIMLMALVSVVGLVGVGVDYFRSRNKETDGESSRRGEMGLMFLVIGGLAFALAHLEKRRACDSWEEDGYSSREECWERYPEEGVHRPPSDY